MRLLLVLALWLFTMPALAVQPDEVLADPALEARARQISRMLRCPVCQGESIDDSNAGISRDLRLYVRERLVAGESNPQVIDAVTDRYGEFVLFEPPLRGINWVLYLTGPILLILGLGLALRYVLARGGVTGADTPLSSAEEAKLAALIRDGVVAADGDNRSD